MKPSKKQLWAQKRNFAKFTLTSVATQLNNVLRDCRDAKRRTEKPTLSEDDALRTLDALHYVELVLKRWSAKSYDEMEQVR